MRYIYNIAALLITLLCTVSCIEEPNMTIEEIERRSLREWITEYHPELLNNYQEEGEYYVEVLDEGVMDSVTVTGKDVWVWYDFTSRSLQGNLLETRNVDIATQINTYNKHTHYVPAYRFSGKDSHTLMEGTYLATFNKLKIGDTEFEVRYGTKLRLYLPSSVVGDSKTNDGGYEGEFAIDSNKPMIVDMTIYGHVGNPVAYEGERVTAFANVNGGVCNEHRAEKEEEDKEAKRVRRSTTRTEGGENEEEEVDTRPLEFFDGRWHLPNDTLEHLLVNYTYTPEKSFDFKNSLGLDTLKYPEENIYTKGNTYANANLDSRINEALIKRFGKGISGDEEILDADSIHTNATAKVWYIGRFLDGFIFDTNIDEVTEILYGEIKNKGEALSFQTKDPVEENDYILAWEYALPTLRLGQWAAIVTVSTYGYGISGKIGSHTSTTTTDGTYDYASYYNYMNYMNNYYGGYYGYGNMYNQGYYGYNPYYYGYTPQVTTTTVTTTSAEIPAFSPLLFQVFVEKE